MVQWLRLHAPNAGGPGSIPGQGTKSHMLQLRVRMPQLKVPRATTKTQHSQINKYFFFKKHITYVGEKVNVWKCYRTYCMGKPLGFSGIFSYFVSWYILLNVYFFAFTDYRKWRDCSLDKEILFLGSFYWLLTCFVCFDGVIFGQNIIFFFSLSSSLRLLVLSKRKFNNKHVGIFNYQVEDFISLWEFS